MPKKLLTNDNIENVIRKDVHHTDNFVSTSNKDRNHFVLTDPSFKKEIINRSTLLKEYWNMFEVALAKTNILFLFGYGGNDPHINELIRKNSFKKIIVIEYRENNKIKKGDREIYWKSKLLLNKYDKKTILIELKSNILSTTKTDFDNHIN
ncbi:MAG: hypothetical protein COV35_05525 [Alphaproteobacteria bacterium CG11_big_fil_rev_8_21_14_0_20_39_49]|nr:MAG: hypothetical protein COV35_05525 [Alphaproteobacteria bacterium CG11_big_fil_rev_8_21_14_0_20_39_49]